MASCAVTGSHHPPWPNHRDDEKRQPFVCRQGHEGRSAHIVDGLAQSQLVGAKVVGPLADTVSLTDDQERYFPVVAQLYEPGIGEALGRGVDNGDPSAASSWPRGRARDTRGHPCTLAARTARWQPVRRRGLPRGTVSVSRRLPCGGIPSSLSSSLLLAVEAAGFGRSAILDGEACEPLVPAGRSLRPFESERQIHAHRQSRTRRRGVLPPSDEPPTRRAMSRLPERSGHVLCRCASRGHEPNLGPGTRGFGSH